MREVPDEIIDRVEQFLREGLSQREVARQTGTSLGTVSRVATGQRKRLGAQRRRREEESTERCGPVRRCPGCGYLVELPCLVCQARIAREQTLRTRRRELLVSGATPAQTELRGEARKRYEALRRTKDDARNDFLDRKAS